jgi:hypothetical protein
MTRRDTPFPVLRAQNNEKKRNTEISDRSKALIQQLGKA